jgi:hypothetical protein
MLKHVGNLFADYTPTPPLFEFMCLPPRSSITIGPNSVRIDIPVRLAQVL